MSLLICTISPSTPYTVPWSEPCDKMQQKNASYVPWSCRWLVSSKCFFICCQKKEVLPPWDALVALPWHCQYYTSFKRIWALQGEIQVFSKGGVQLWINWNELAMLTRGHWRCCGGRVWEGVKPSLAGQELWGTSPGRFPIWALSRHSSALFQGQDLSPTLTINLNFTNYWAD